MRYRKLRIAWSIFWGLGAVLMIALWVRSHGQDEHILWNRTTKSFCVSVYPGQVSLESVNGAVMMPMGWSHVVFPNSGNDSSSEGDEPRSVLGFGWHTDHGATAAYIQFWFLRLA